MPKAIKVRSRFCSPATPARAESDPGTGRATPLPPTMSNAPNRACLPTATSPAFLASPLLCASPRARPLCGSLTRTPSVSWSVFPRAQGDHNILSPQSTSYAEALKPSRPSTSASAAVLAVARKTPSPSPKPPSPNPSSWSSSGRPKGTSPPPMLSSRSPALGHSENPRRSPKGNERSSPTHKSASSPTETTPTRPPPKGHARSLSTSTTPTPPSGASYAQPPPTHAPDRARARRLSL